MDCIFCKITKGEIPCAKVHEDNDVFAFLDIRPITKGHCLVIPKQHFADIFEMDSATLEKITNVGKQLAEKLKVTFDAQGLNLVQSNGAAAGQEVLHFHLHLIPRYAHDELEMQPIWKARSHTQANLEELNELAKKIAF